MSQPAQTLMEREAREAPAAVARVVRESDGALAALGAHLRALAPGYAVAAGRGSSDHAGLLAKYLFELRLGVPTVSAAPSIRSIYGGRLELAKALVLAISQSGRSPDLIEFCRAATGPDVLRVGLLNDVAAPLAQAVDVCLGLEAGPEQSVAATKSCLAAMALTFGLAAYWRNDTAMIAAFARAPQALAAALEMDWSAADAFLDGEGPVYVVGRGPGLAIAEEAALKLKETCGLHAEAVSGAEIRHGPLALAGPTLRVLVFAQRDAAFAGLKQLSDDLAARGTRVMFVSADAAAIQVAPDDESVIELLAMLQRFYLFANAAALRRGRSPDAPPALSKITETH